MKKYFSLYIETVLKALESEDTDFKRLESEMLVKISFMQHERLIHFLVIVLFALLMFLSLIAFFISEYAGLMVAALMMFGLLIPYIPHYYFLENNVQKLYSLYDKARAKIAPER